MSKEKLRKSEELSYVTKHDSHAEWALLVTSELGKEIRLYLLLTVGEISCFFSVASMSAWFFYQSCKKIFERYENPEKDFKKVWLLGPNEITKY